MAIIFGFKDILYPPCLKSMQYIVKWKRIEVIIFNDLKVQVTRN